MPILIEVSKKDYERIKFSDSGVVSFGVYCHKYLFNTFEKDVYSEDNILVFGTGPLAGGILPGTHRIIFIFRSPLTKGLYVSAMGGAGYHLYKTGERLFCIKGRSENPLIIGISDKEVKFFEISEEELWRVYGNYKGYFGAKALALYSYDLLKNFLGDKFRVFCVGPGAFKTDFGSINSYEISKSGLRYDDFAGRGGGGSVLARAHNVVLIGFTGKKEDFNFPLRKIEKIKEIFEKNGMKYPESILKATTKYRYKEELKSGGTFGANYSLLKLWTPYGNWRMVYDNRDKRKEIFEKIIGENWWEEFNKETIEKKTWDTCGEPCPVQCKKYYKEVKVDYEPFEGLGPNIRVFDIKRSKELVKLVDNYGLDAIETGNLASFFLEAEEKGVIKISGDTPEEKVRNLIEDVIENGLDGNLREISKEMELKDIAVYVPFGKEGAITPNYYWSLGVLLPLPVPGRYWTYYKFGVFKDPEEFALECYKNGIKEAVYDDLGICRFHRKWIYNLLNDLLIEVSSGPVDIKERGRNIIKEIYEYNKISGAEPAFWESERVKDIIILLAKETGNPWYERFEADRENALREYWERFWKEYDGLVTTSIDYETFWGESK